jgi:hypothetical protein
LATPVGWMLTIAPGMAAIARALAAVTVHDRFH